MNIFDINISFPTFSNTCTKFSVHLSLEIVLDFLSAPAGDTFLEVAVY